MNKFTQNSPYSPSRRPPQSAHILTGEACLFGEYFLLFPLTIHPVYSSLSSIKTQTVALDPKASLPPREYPYEVIPYYSSFLLLMKVYFVTNSSSHLLLIIVPIR